MGLIPCLKPQYVLLILAIEFYKFLQHLKLHSHAKPVEAYVYSQSPQTCFDRLGMTIKLRPSDAYAPKDDADRLFPHLRQTYNVPHRRDLPAFDAKIHSRIFYFYGANVAEILQRLRQSFFIF